MKFTLNSKIKLSDDLISRVNQDNTIIVMRMDDDEFFYKIEGVAAEIWLKLNSDQSIKLETIVNELANSYKMNSEIIINDSQEFLNKVLNLKFISIEN